MLLGSTQSVGKVRSLFYGSDPPTLKRVRASGSGCMFLFCLRMARLESCCPG